MEVFIAAFTPQLNVVARVMLAGKQERLRKMVCVEKFVPRILG